MKKTIKYIFYVFLGLVLGILTLAFMVFNSNRFQNYLTSKVTDILSTQFKTKISINHIRYYPFNGFALEQVYWGDQKNDTLFYVENLRFNFGGFNSIEQKLTLNDVVVDGAYCKMVTYPDHTFNIDVLFNILDPNDTIPDTLSPPFKLYFNRVACHNTRFRLIDSTKVFEPQGFDGFNQDFTHIELLARDFWIIKDSLHFDLKKLACVERSGLVLKQLSGITTICPEAMLFDEMELVTAHSRISNSFHMTYNGWDEMGDFNQKVHLKGNLESSTFGMKDLHYFAPQLKEMKLDQSFAVNGDASGTVSNLRLKNMLISFGSQSLFKGSGCIKGLPSIDDMFLDIHSDMAIANAPDLEHLLKMDLPQEMDRLGNMSFAGQFTGFYTDFVAFGNFSTVLGSGRSDLNMKLGDSTTLPSYSGNLVLKDFDIGKLFSQPIIGRTSLTASVNGKGFNIKDLETKLRTSVEYIEANHYRYQKIDISGAFNHKMFEGKLDMNDEHAEVHFNGTVDLNKEIPLYKFKADIAYADLKALHIDTADVVFSTSIDINFAIKNLDENAGEVVISNTLFIKNGVDYPIEQIKLSSQINGNSKSLSLKMDMLSASMDGVFSFSQLPVTGRLFMHRLLPEYISAPAQNITRPDNFNFNITIDDSRILSEILFPNITIERLKLTGSVNGQSGDITAKGNVALLRINDYDLHNIELENNWKNGNSSTLNVQVDAVQQHDTVLLKTISIHSTVNKSTAKTTIEITDTVGLLQTHLITSTLFANQSIRTTFLPSTFTFKNKLFRISNEGEVVYENLTRKTTITNFAVHHLDESVTVNGFYAIESGLNMKAEINRFSLSLIELFAPNLGFTIDGICDGSVTVKGDGKNMYVNSYLNLNNVALDNDTIGDFTFTSNYDELQQRLITHAKSINGKLKNMELGGYMDMRSKPYPINYSIVFAESDLKSFQAFLKGNVSIYNGTVSAKCKVTGTTNSIHVDGSVNLIQVLARIEYLKTTYGFNTKINFDRNSINVNPFFLNDVNGKQAKVEGTVSHQSFSNFEFDLKLTELNSFQVLNTTSKDNTLFYGKAYATGRMSLKGRQGDLVLDANLKSAKGTVFSIPLTEEDGSASNGLVNFVSTDTLVKTVNIKKSSKLLGLGITMFVTVTPDAEIQIVFDELQDDKIIGSGRGTLKMELTKQGVFSMFGEVTIESGEYKFTAVDVFTRKFLLKKGGTITWTGDPLQARMNIQGIYKVRNTSIADLITTASDADKEALRSQRVPVECVLNLKGKLLSPDIGFDLNFPDNNALVGNTASALESSLRRLRAEPELMQQQVVSLMLFGKFAPTNGLAASNNQNLNTGLNNTVSDLISAQASNLISKVIPGFDVSADFQTATESQKSRTILTASKKLLNERLEIQTSFSLDAQGIGNNNNIMGQYNITPDGNLKFRAYNRSTSSSGVYTGSQTGITNNQNIITQGIGLYYRKEFDKFNELFKRKNAKVVVPPTK
ncbi:MAG: translocation/assembly module TamB domain-containing protein [Bacteroidota bacterium]